MNKKENWFKRNYKVSWGLNLIFLILVILFLIQYIKFFINYEEYPFGEDLLIKQYSQNTYKTKVSLKNVTIETSFNGKPLNSLIQIYNENLNLIEENYTSHLDFKDINGKFYGKITIVVNFTENNASETRYTWLLFELNKNSLESFFFNISYAPKIWEEKPTIKW